MNTGSATLATADPACTFCRGTGWEEAPMGSAERRFTRSGDGIGVYVCRCITVQRAPRATEGGDGK